MGPTLKEQTVKSWNPAINMVYKLFAAGKLILMGIVMMGRIKNAFLIFLY